ncbi:hypothetical protein AB0C59_30120 [Streptomyces sp. NPDC048664]|uniref:hypothetical protein n=1 Tax=Streptomyces sp. NPDC048664 TaxID=3154505 RepID=UPI00343F05A2
MIHDVNDLGRVGRLLHEVLELLEGEQTRLEKLHGAVSYQDYSAGSPMQTLFGIRELCGGVRDALKYVALALGHHSLGLEERAAHAVRMARMSPVGLPSGADRMERPLGEATVRALEKVRELDGFLPGNFGLAVEVALAAPQATYPPDDWTTYREQRLNSPE